MPGSSRSHSQGCDWTGQTHSRQFSRRIGSLFPTDWNWRLEAKLGGDLRAVSDIGTHWLDLVTWLTNSKVSDLCADLATVLPTRRRPEGPRGNLPESGRSGD